MSEQLREAIRQCIDDSALMHTGRSLGDLASGYVADDLIAGPLRSVRVSHNHTRWRNDDGPWSACPESCPLAVEP